MKKVIVTGGAGFIGSHVVERLSKGGYEVLVIDDFSSGKAENLEGLEVEIENMNIVNEFRLERVFSEFAPDYTVHLAAQPAITLSEEDPNLDARINILGTINILKMAQKHSKRFVFASTSAVYQKSAGVLSEDSPTLPDSPYGVSKLAAEHYVRLLFPNHAILRFGNVYGPRQVPLGENQVIPRMIRHFLFGDEFYIHGSGEQKRDFVYVEDVARAVELALEKGCGKFNISTGISLRVNDVARALEELFGVPGTYAWEHNGEDQRGDVFIGPLLAMTDCDWESRISFREGLRRTVEWWQKRGR